MYVCMYVLSYVLTPNFLFISLPLIFTLLAASISHFLFAAVKFSRFSSNEILLLNNTKKDSTLLLLFFSL